MSCYQLWRETQMQHRLIHCDTLSDGKHSIWDSPDCRKRIKHLEISGAHWNNSWQHTDAKTHQKTISLPCGSGYLHYFLPTPAVLSFSCSFCAYIAVLRWNNSTVGCLTNFSQPPSHMYKKTHGFMHCYAAFTTIYHWKNPPVEVWIQTLQKSLRGKWFKRQIFCRQHCRQGNSKGGAATLMYKHFFAIH